MLEVLKYAGVIYAIALVAFALFALSSWDPHARH
jgi:hypothetical protein